MAFYDNVALIANRAIFTIDPLPPKEPAVPVVTQPKRKIRWFENEDDFINDNQNVVRERRSTLIRRKMSVVPEEDNDTISQTTIDTVDGGHQENKNENERVKPEEVKTNGEVKKDNKEILNESDKNKTELVKPIENSVELRKKTLQERRTPKGLTLMINRPELPVIRQNLMPKFYLDTPEENQIYYTGVSRTPSLTLTAPVKPISFEFDLKSVVQIQKDVPPPSENANKPKRTQSVKEKLLKRQSSSQSINPHNLASIHM
ncbi:uncharacterized protein [Onthophagus taurus]|nr:uncharacterized protein LOC111415252 isoform X2 [Onthophagus taurus]